MMRFATTKSFVLIILIAVLFPPISAVALEHSFTENFATKTYCDTVNTTAWWRQYGETGGQLSLWPFHMGFVGTCSFAEDNAFGIAISGKYAYVTRNAGLAVVDVSNPTNPVQVGYCAIGGQTFGVAVDGDYAYVADGAAGLKAIDISNPSNPTVVGGISEGFGARGVTVSGDYAYVAAGTSGLIVIDITDPVNLGYAGDFDTPGFALEVAVDGDYAYVADNGSGLRVIDISDPAVPVSAGVFATADSAKGVVVYGDYAFVAAYGSGLEIVNISNPASPTLKGRCDTAGRANGVAIDGDHAYVADGSHGLQAIDVRNTPSPVWTDSCGTSDYATKVVVRGEYAYVTDGSADLKIIHISDATLPPIQAAFYNIPAPGCAIDVAGDFVYLAAGSRLFVIGIDWPNTPDTVGVFGPITSQFTDVVVSGDYADATDDSLGFRSIDITGPDAPFLAGYCPVPDGGYGLAIAGDYAYVAAGPSGLQVIDISDPTSPSIAGSCAIAGHAYGVAISGDFAYVADGPGGLAIVDISSPTTPTFVTSFSTSDLARAVAVSGDLAYVAAGGQGLVIIDISSPQTPTLVSVCNISGYAHSVAVIGKFAFVSRYVALHVIDVGNPGSPQMAAVYPTVAENFGFAISGDHAFLAENPIGLEVVQVFQRWYNLQANTAQSVVFFESENQVSAARVAAVQGELVLWYVSADSGASWTQIPTDDQWHPLDSPGRDLLWRSKHYYRQYAQNADCGSVTVFWKYNFAEIDSVKDIPEDEGGWVRVRFNGSGLDLAGRTGEGVGVQPPGSDQGYGSTFGVTQTGAIKTYFAHRRIDDIGFMGKLLEKGTRLEGDRPAAVNSENGNNWASALPSTMAGAQGYLMDGHYYYVNEASGGFPPGIWETVGSVPALQRDQYYCLVPTVADSTSTLRYTVYCVTAHTEAPTTYYISPPDSGYSRDNLPPRQPSDLKGDYGYPPPRLYLSWGRNIERDFSHYTVYKGTSEDFVPSESNRIGAPWDTFLVDEEFDPNTENYYKVTAWDIHENEGVSTLLTPEDISEAGHPPAVPIVTSVEQNAPNPFNPVTVIKFSIAQPGWAALRVYDVAGRPMRTLMEGIRGAGTYEVKWDGRDDAGRGVASGIYLYKLEAPWFSETRKMVLIR